MMVNSKDMMGVPVETRSGQALGKLASFDLAAETGALRAIRVKTRGLLADELLVSWDAVMEMTPQKIVVADGTVSQGARALAQAEPMAPTPTLMKEG